MKDIKAATHLIEQATKHMQLLKKDGNEAFHIGAVAELLGEVQKVLGLPDLPSMEEIEKETKK